MPFRPRFRLGPALLVALLAAAIGGSAQAGPIELFFPTGNAELDLNATRFPGAVAIVQDNPLNGGASNDVGQAAFMTQAQTISGWNFKDIRYAYDPASRALGVAVNFFKAGDAINLGPLPAQNFPLGQNAVAGDVDGNGLPSVTAPQTLLAGGVDQPLLSGGESITLALDVNIDGTFDYVVGVPANKPIAAVGTSTFTFARYNQVAMGVQPGIERSYGASLPQFTGQIAYESSMLHPDFEFTIPNFLDLPGLSTTIDPLTGGTLISFRVAAYAGTLDDVVSGEDLFDGTISNLVPVPEPATFLLWGAAGALVALRFRQRQRRPRD